MGEEMNKAITQGLVLMPPPFSAGLNLWSDEEHFVAPPIFTGDPLDAPDAGDLRAVENVGATRSGT